MMRSLVSLSVGYVPSYFSPLIHYVTRGAAISNSCENSNDDGFGDNPKAPLSPEAAAARSAQAVEIASKMSGDPQLATSVLEKLSGNQRRLFLVASAAREWHGEDNVKRQLRDADRDRDRVISKEDYDVWIHRSYLASQKAIKADIPWSTLIRVAFVSGCPFIAFGTLDNTIMLLSGDAIDSMFGSRFQLSGMAAAALGGICSGVIGIQMHGAAGQLVAKLGFKKPPLTPAQARSSTIFQAKHIGGTLGMACGLMCGMWPLLILSATEEDATPAETANFAFTAIEGKR